MKTKIIISGVSFLLVSGIALYMATGDDGLEQQPQLVESTEARLEKLQQAPSSNVPKLPKPLQKREKYAADDLVLELSKRMREQFADNIMDIVVQVRLKEMRVGLEVEYPGQGEAMFERIVRLAFPQLADQILAAVGKMDEYDEWLVENYLDLNELNPVAKDNRIWSKRIDIFGEESAKRIWNEEVAQEQQRERNVKTVMNELNVARDISMEDRIYTMQTVMQENYGDTPEGMLMGTANVTTQLVFRLGTVQEELSAMDTEQRQQTINQMRLQLGFPEDRIEQLAQEDLANEERWQKGYAYMEERTQLMASYQGDDLETELDLLRLKHFDDRTAYSLKQEEAINMMRFERERVYGLN